MRESNKIKEESLTKIEFDEKDRHIDTSLDSLNYIGETSQYFFIYNPIKRNTLIFNKNKLSNIKIKDVTPTDEEIKKNVDNFIKKVKKQIVN